MGAQPSALPGATHEDGKHQDRFEDEIWTACETDWDLLTMESWTMVDGDLIASLSDTQQFTIIPSAEELTSWIGKLRRARHYCVFREAPEHIRNSRDAVYAAVCGDANVLDFAPEIYRHDRDIVMAAVKRQCLVFEDVAEEFRADREVALLAVRGNGRLLKCAAEALHKDRQLVKAAVKTHSSALLLCPQEFWDADLVLAAIPKKRDYMFRSLMDNKKVKQVFNDWHFVMDAVQHDPLSLQFASSDLKADKELVMCAVKLRWQALQHASYELQSDQDVVRAALAQTPLALQFAADNIKNNRDLVLEVVKQDPQALSFASRKLRADDVVSATAYAMFVAQKRKEKQSFPIWS
mmetsp:Transcript_152045/g.269448  ORF Transcript_152045/g.269448 Transcript_152045/m.269448 type:complete len:351 (-) Transcript_152045:85-1137(-)